MSKLYVNIDSTLLSEAKETIKFTIIDSDGKLRELEAPIDYTNPYKVDIAPFIPQTVQFNLNRFFDLSKQLIDNASQREGVPTVPIVEEYPPLDMAKITTTGELVTFRLISREPGNMDVEASGRPQRNFRNYYRTKEANYGDNTIEILNRPLDHEIEFTIWATSNKLANKRALWLESLFVTHAWVWRSQGADRFFFKRRLQDGYFTTGQQRLFYRPLRFFLRYNEFLIKAGFDIKNIQVDLALGNNVES